MIRCYNIPALTRTKKLTNSIVFQEAWRMWAYVVVLPLISTKLADKMQLLTDLVYANKLTFENAFMYNITFLWHFPIRIYFWYTSAIYLPTSSKKYFELLRVLKPGWIIYLNLIQKQICNGKLSNFVGYFENQVGMMVIFVV